MEVVLGWCGFGAEAVGDMWAGTRVGRMCHSPLFVSD